MMIRRYCRRRCAWAMALAAVLTTVLSVGSMRVIAEEETPTIVDSNGTKIIIEEEEELVGFVGDYWIGIYPQTLNQDVAEKWNIKVAQGVIVGEVMPESPAAQAKLMRGDVLVAAGDRELSRREELAEIVRGSEGKTIKLKVRRGDKVLDIEVTPAKQVARPNVLFFGGKGREVKHEQAEQREKLEGMLRKIREHQLQNERARSQGGNPGRGMIVRVRPGEPEGPQRNLPDDMQVTIQKRGSKPARVTVKQGEKMWQTTERELGILPSEALGYVAQLLGRPMMPGMGGYHTPATEFRGAGQRLEIREGVEGDSQFVAPKGIEPQFVVPAAAPGVREIDLYVKRLQQLRRELEQQRQEAGSAEKKKAAE